MSINPNIFKAYDVRGLYPQEVNEEAARLIGRGFVAYLNAKRIAVSRDMRLSSPSMAQAFIEGALLQGADVVDYGMMGTDMLYFAVARDGHDGGVQITASHNPKEYNGIKMVRREAFPLSGESGIGDIRDMIAASQLPPPAAAPGRLTQQNVVEDYVTHVMSFIDPSIIKPFNLVLDAGNGIAGMIAPKLFERLPCRVDALCFEVDGTFPNHEATRSSKRTVATSSSASWQRSRTSASRGMATRTAASSSTAPASSSPGTSSPRFSPRRSSSSILARRSCTTCAPAMRSRTSSRNTAGPR